MPGKREVYLTWNEYFMEHAILSSRRSKDPSTQVGACIVSNDNRILSIGYNGAPNGFSDDEFRDRFIIRDTAFFITDKDSNSVGYTKKMYNIYFTNNFFHLLPFDTPLPPTIFIPLCG